MRFQPGARVGRYEVLAHIASGGMGDVYRARDTHLDKQVALKTIAPAFARDPASQPRFDRERRLTSGLEHPHICRVLDAGEQDGIAYFAMEYLDGESLAERLARGPLPPNVAIGYAIEIADALAYAHRHGVIHRDLKPANVFLTRSGAKVLDFGLAKLRPTGADTPALRGDTVPLDVSHPGMLVGSAPYMAPERLEGHDADHRTDVFGFGLLLYEMLTGRRAFDGNTPATLIAAILSQEPAPLRLPEQIAADIDWVLRKCLAKKPDDRWQSMADLQIVLKRIAGAGFIPPQPAASTRARIVPVIALVGIAIAAALGWIAWRELRARGGSEPLALRINPPPSGTFTPTESSVQTPQFALAPDGRAIAFVAAGADGVSRLWVQRFSALAAVPLPGTEGATYPFWSPDSRRIGFFTARALRRIDAIGGPPQTVAATRHARGGSWNAAGEILFAPNASGTIMLTSIHGATPREVTQLDQARRDGSHRWPHFLPDGRHFLYFNDTIGESDTHEGVYCTSLDGGPPTLVAHTNAGAVFVPPDRVLVLSDGTLVAHTLDPRTCAVAGDAVPVVDEVGRSSNFYGAFSAATTGALAYASNAMPADLVWIDRTGRPSGTLATGGEYVDFRLSPDGTAVAIAEIDRDTESADIYVKGLTSDTRALITSSHGTDASPVWSPDGRRIVFRSNRQGIHELYIRDASGSGPEVRFQPATAGKYPTSWSPDGRIAFHTRQSATGWDVMVASTAGDTTPRAVADSDDDEVQGQFSKDGRLLAYVSDEIKPAGLFVRAGSGVRQPVPGGGGTDPRWRADGRELFYISTEGQLTAVAVHQRGDKVEFGRVQPLFAVRATGFAPPFTSAYDVSSDGQKFLVRIPRGGVGSTPLSVLLNWPLTRRQ